MHRRAFLVLLLVPLLVWIALVAAAPQLLDMLVLQVPYQYRVLRSPAEQAYKWSSAAFGMLAIAGLLTPFIRDRWHRIARLHRGQVVMLWAAGAFALILAYLAWRGLRSSGGLRTELFLLVLLPIVVVVSLGLPFAVTWKWFSHRPSTPVGTE